MNGVETHLFYFSFPFFCVLEFLVCALFLVGLRCLVLVLRVGWIFTVSGLLGFLSFLFCSICRPDFFFIRVYFPYWNTTKCVPPFVSSVPGFDVSGESFHHSDHGQELLNFSRFSIFFLIGVMLILWQLLLILRPPLWSCGLVVRVVGYRSWGPGSIPGTTRKKK
jgi:hypothetical protein